MDELSNLVVIDDAPPPPVKKRPPPKTADEIARMERARIYVTRGMSRRLIRIKCKLSDAEFDELQKWARKIASRRR